MANSSSKEGIVSGCRKLFSSDSPLGNPDNSASESSLESGTINGESTLFEGLGFSSSLLSRIGSNSVLNGGNYGIIAGGGPSRIA